MIGWQAMGNAPKDGMRLDLWCVRYELIDPAHPNVTKVGKRFVDCAWKRPIYAVPQSYISGAGLGGSLMQEPSGSWDGFPSGWTPTHWMRAGAPEDN